MIISPSILAADFGHLLEDVKKVESSGCEYLHIDIMDGHFVPNISFGPMILKAIQGKTSLFMDVHLMIENPDLYIEEFVKAGAQMITVHQEACPHLHRTIQNIKSYGIKAGVSLNPATPISVLEDILPELDMVLIMSVNPGFGGQSFIESALRKITALKSMIDERHLTIDIEVDGGIKADNVGRVLEAGANVIVAGSALFAAKDFSEEVQKFRMEAKRVGC